MKKIIIGFAVLGTTLTFAQAGVNTKEPQAPLHIDAKGDTQNNTQTKDDIVVDKDGNLGIGTLNPKSKLEVHGNVVVADEDVVKGNVKAKVMTTQAGIRIGKEDLIGIQDGLEIFGEGIGKGLKLENEPQINDTNLRYVPVMTQKSNDGVLTWTNLPTVTTTVEGNVSGTIGTNWSNITSEIYLSQPGYWIVLISFTSLTTDSHVSNKNRSNVFVQLWDETNQREITRGASSTESSGFKVGAPQYMHVVKVESPTKIRGRAKCLFTTNVQSGVEFWGYPKFYAIRIN